MDPYAEAINKHLKNFNQFAGQVTKVFIPIIDTAIKMSTEEPVSAYSVYKAAIDIANNKNKFKKTPNGAGKRKSATNRVKKLACAPASKANKVSNKVKLLNKSGRAKGGTNNSNKMAPKKKQSHSKQTLLSNNSNSKKYKGSEVINLVEQLYTDEPKKLTKVDQKKKKVLEDAIVHQLEMDNAETEGDTSMDGDISKMELTYSDSEIYSDEYTIEDDIFIDDEIEEKEESFCNNGDDKETAEALAQEAISKAYKKRKSPQIDVSTRKSNNVATNAISKSKKSKQTAIKVDKDLSEPLNHRRASLASLDNFSKKSTPKSASTTTVSNLKLEPLSPPGNIVKLNSIEEGKRALTWLLNPVTVDAFFDKYWEQNACLIKRQQTNYFKHLISFEDIDQMLLKNHVEFTKNIDVTSYKKGVRETHNPEGRALPPVVWDHYGQGCSIRLLNPQTFLPALFTLNTTLQEYFHCLVGANAYLTPPNSQGFAPHYDDIEAFVLQIEGRKRWKLYKPRSTAEILPRYSSNNFTQQEIGKPVLDEVLEPGDVLYFPRGTIHQACTEPGYHSLHITLSVYQKQSFADLFEKMLPIMLQKAIASNVDLRRGLPLHAWQHAGIAFSDNSTKERDDLTKRVTQIMHKCILEMPLQHILDAGMDQLAKKFQHEALPPEILPSEKLRTVFGSRSHTNKHGECVCDYDIDERTNVRLLRANILRLVEEEKKIRIYYYLDNSKQYCEYEPNFIEIEATEAASVEILIKSYPHYVGVSQLPLPSDEQKINLATALWERGLLMMEKPFR